MLGRGQAIRWRFFTKRALPLQHEGIFDSQSRSSESWGKKWLIELVEFDRQYARRWQVPSGFRHTWRARQCECLACWMFRHSIWIKSTSWREWLRVIAEGVAKEDLRETVLLVSAALMWITEECLKTSLEGNRGNVARILFLARDEANISQYQSLLAATAVRLHKQFLLSSTPSFRQSLLVKYRTYFLRSPSYYSLDISIWEQTINWGASSS